MLKNMLQDKGTAFVLGDSGFLPAEVNRTSDSGNKYKTNVDLCIRAYTVSTAPKKTSITSLKGVSKGFKVKWKKVSGVTGYQIQYCKKKNFSSGAKIITVRKKTLFQLER